jgi:ABC-2 type transport system permease protein
MNVRAIWEMTRTEFKITARNFISMFFSLLFPSLMLFMFGGIYGNTPQEIFNGYGTLDVTLPAYSVIIIAVTGIMNLPLSISTYRERKVLKRYMATPMSPSYVIFSQIVVNFVLSIAGMLILAGVGAAVYDLHFMGEFWPVAFAYILSILASFAIGFIIASTAPNMKAATAIANTVYFPMLFLTGATFPLELMPDTMRNISKAFPLTYAVELLKGVWLGGSLSDYAVQIIVLASVFVVGIIVSILLFRWE